MLLAIAPGRRATGASEPNTRTTCTRRGPRDTAPNMSLVDAAAAPVADFEAGIEPSVGSVGDSCDNAMAESVIGLYTTEVIRREGPWRSIEAVEYETLQWVDCFNQRRLLEPTGYVPPLKLASGYYEHKPSPVMVSELMVRNSRSQPYAEWRTSPQNTRRAAFACSRRTRPHSLPSLRLRRPGSGPGEN